MPRYVYKCQDCEEIFEVMHSMSSVYDNCDFCQSSNICKIPAKVSLRLTRSEKQTGEVVKQHIKEALHDLKKQKSEAKSIKEE